MKRALIFCFWLCSVTSALGEDRDGSGLKVGANADLNGQFGVGAPTSATQRLLVREAELILTAPADHLFDGRISLAAHQENGEANFELHEAFIGSSKLIPRSRFRVGQYFVGVGRLNQIHRHDWLFISPPVYHPDFFGSTEGLLDTGAEFSYLTPLPFYFDITIGVTNGYTFGHAHNAGTKPNEPTHYIRGVTFFNVPWDGQMQVGLNYLGNRSATNIERRLIGLDLVAKWKEDKVVQFLIESEIWYRIYNIDTGNAEAARSVGMYFFPNYYLGENFYLGLRADFFTQLNLKVGPDTIQNLQTAFVPTLSWRPSEFTTFRLAYTHMDYSKNQSPFDSNRMLELQAVFILGAHPAHDF